MHSKTKQAGWGTALFVILMVAAMLYSKSAKFADIEEAAAFEMTGSIAR